jgi:hypothetical protein
MIKACHICLHFWPSRAGHNHRGQRAKRAGPGRLLAWLSRRKMKGEGRNKIYCGGSCKELVVPAVSAGSVHAVVSFRQIQLLENNICLQPYMIMHGKLGQYASVPMPSLYGHKASIKTCTFAPWNVQFLTPFNPFCCVKNVLRVQT